MGQQDELKLKADFRIIDTESVQDITDTVKRFEITTTHGFSTGNIELINGFKAGLVEKTEWSTNKILSVKIFDDKGNEFHRMMEIMK